MDVGPEEQPPNTAKSEMKWWGMGRNPRRPALNDTRAERGEKKTNAGIAIIADRERGQAHLPLSLPLTPAPVPSN